MSAPPTKPPTAEAVSFQDEALADAATTGVEVLRALADRWRLRLQAGRLGAHPYAESARLVDRLEAAARILETGSAGGVAAPVHHAPLHEHDERFRVLLDGVKDYAITLLDPGARIMIWNGGAERILGYRAEDVIGEHVSILYPQEDRAQGVPDRHLAVASREGRWEEEGVRVRKDGTRLLASIVLSALHEPDGALRGFTKVMRDVTERRCAIEVPRQGEERFAEEKLRHSEETFRLMIEAVRDYAIFMLDPTGHVASWNVGAERIKGYRADEILGKHLSVFYTEPDRLREHPDEELRRAVAEGTYQEEGWRVRKDGSHFWASIVITAIFDAEGKHLGFTKVTRDMTERKEAEEALHRANEALEARVRAQQTTQREAEAFSYSVSHDLRAPLRALDGFSVLLLEQAKSRLTPEQQEYLARIRAAAQQMSALIDAMLLLSRLVRAPVHPETVDLSAVSREIAASLAQAEPARAVRFSVADGITIAADPRFLRIALENLLRNAWKFTRNAAEPSVEVGVVTKDGERVFYVRDNGAGFDMSQAHRLFVPFQRLHRAKEFEGTGIGLATVSRIIQRHDGRLWAEGAPGQGATFYFTIGGRDAG